MPGFMGAIKRALTAFGSHTQFTAMRRAAMNRPFGWQRSARGYGHLYGGLMKSGSAA
jgi:starch synthase